MPGLIRNLRDRSFAAFGWLAMLLAVAGLTAAGLESISFGHEHLAGGHALHHHHVFLGSHEHGQGHENDHGQEHGHDHEQENEEPPERPGQPGTAMVSAAPALFQPIAFGVLVAGPAVSSLLEPPLAPRPAARFALQPSSPRGPPLSSALPRL